MLKRFFLALSALIWLASPLQAVGTIPSLSLSQQLDQAGNPLSGCLLYFFQAGSTTPQSAFKDTALTLPQPNPMTCDSAGRIGQFFLADGQIKIRLDSKLGVTQVAADNILVLGPSSGGGGGGSVDPTTVATTGDLKVAYGTQTITGWVRLNGRTIGSATSGATERANSDTQTLFQYLWGADANLAVSGGRGASSIADWNANKTIVLPDYRGRAIAGLDDMGNSAAGRLTATYFGTAATVLGAAGGVESKTILQANFPSVNFNINAGAIATPIAGAFIEVNTGAPFTNSPSGGSNASFIAGTASAQANAAVTGTVASGGSGTPIAVASPMMLATVYIKL